MQYKKQIPWLMVMGRAALGPVVALGQRCGWSGSTLAILVLTALVSDIVDGVLARRWQTDTAALRLGDSLSDTAFYLCVAITISFGMPTVWRACRTPVLVLLACEALRLAFDLHKFRRPASYHSLLAKGWGMLLATAVVFTVLTKHSSVWLTLALRVGMLTSAEGFILSLILPVWRRDVPTLAAALRLRAHLHCGQTAKLSTSRLGAGGACTLVFAAMLGGAPCHAQGLRHVTYLGGTAPSGSGLHGTLSVAPTNVLLFQASSSTLSIPYDHVVSYESTTQPQVHVGLLTEGLWRLVAPWPEAKRLSLSYRDADDHIQVIVLGMSRADEALLVEVLKARVLRQGEPHPVTLVRPPLAGRPAAVP